MWVQLRYFCNISWLCCCCLVAKSCWNLCDPMDYSPPGSSIHGIFQTRMQELVAISFSRGSSSFFFTGDLLTQGSNLHILHWQADSLMLSHLRSPKRDTHRETNRRGRTGAMLLFVTVNCEPVIRATLTYSFWKGLHNLAVEFQDSHLL